MRNLTVELLVSIFLNILSSSLSFSQEVQKEKTASEIGLFRLPGHELPERPISRAPDTANYKPENFSFRIWDRKNLTDRLGLDVPIGPVRCKPSWGMFIFRVNALGKVDSTWYRGNLPEKASDKILSNIRGTEGNWIVKKGTKPNHVAWFVYPYFDIRGLIEKKSGCSDTDLELLRTVSHLSNLFSILFFQVDKDNNRAIMLRPEEVDGSPKL